MTKVAVGLGNYTMSMFGKTMIYNSVFVSHVKLFSCTLCVLLAVCYLVNNHSLRWSHFHLASCQEVWIGDYAWKTELVFNFCTERKKQKCKWLLFYGGTDPPGVCLDWEEATQKGTNVTNFLTLTQMKWHGHNLNERGTWEMTAVPHNETSACNTQNKQITNSSNHCISF